MLKLFLIACFSVICLSAIAQGGKDSSVPLFFEKAWLHTDRDVYGQGEDIWFKAYVVNAQDNAPVNYSHNLYVELIGPQARLVKRETIRLEDGLGNGDFKLSDTISPGRYRIRAYTNWMRNFGDNFVFEKYITILQTSGISADISKNKPAAGKKNKGANTVSVSISSLPVVRFYPEGGTMVTGIRGTIGVKAEDASGKGIAANGSIQNNMGQNIAAFSCDSLGFGSFTLQPQAGQYYQALVMIKGREQRFILPEVQASGFGLGISYLNADTVKAIISAYPATLGGHLQLVARHGGKSYVRQGVTLNKNNAITAIPSNRLPEGITAITLYNEQGQPQCERLIYIHHPGNKDNVIISTNKKGYQPKQQVTVSIRTLPHANLSLAAVDVDAAPVQPENIASYFNLQSEIRGTVEQPCRYFDTTNVNRFKQLDELLLTQGWRNFVWRRLEDTTLRLNYDVETGITLTGKVIKQWSKKPLPNMNITVFAPKAITQKLFTTITDTLGKFTVYGADFFGYQFISFNSIKNNGKDGGRISVDSLYQDTLKIEPAKFFIPAVRIQNSDSLSGRSPTRKFTFNGNNQLREVEIKERSNQIPLLVHHVTKQDQKEYVCLGQYLLSVIPGSRYAFKKCKGEGEIQGMLATHPYIPGVNIQVQYTDHSSVIMDCYTDLVMVSMKYVINITIRGNLVNVVLRAGALDVQNFMNNTVADMVGYYKAREFYKPRFEDPGDTDPRTNTIHWEPNITTDSNGEATVTFYNTNRAGKIRLVAEGVTHYGTPLVATTNYEVK